MLYFNMIYVLGVSILQWMLFELWGRGCLEIYGSSKRRGWASYAESFSNTITLYSVQPAWKYWGAEATTTFCFIFKSV